MLKRSLIALLLTTTQVCAQQQATPEVEALSAKLLQEINNAVSCSTNLITLKREVDRLTAELKTKREPVKKESAQ